MCHPSGLHVNHLVVILVCLLAAISYPIAFVNAQSINDQLYSPQSKPYGVSYSTWIVKWTQWITSIPSHKNPAYDTTGEYCSEDQQGPVWFLAGTFGGSVKRTCTIPSGMAILTPVISAFCTYLTDSPINTEPGLRQCAQEDNDRAEFHADLDGMAFSNLESYRLTSNLSSFTIPSDNPYGFPNHGITKTIVDGVFLFLKPLSPGEHILHFRGELLFPPESGRISYQPEATYNLKVE